MGNLARIENLKSAAGTYDFEKFHTGQQKPKIRNLELAAGMQDWQQRTNFHCMVINFRANPLKPSATCTLASSLEISTPKAPDTPDGKRALGIIQALSDKGRWSGEAHANRSR